MKRGLILLAVTALLLCGCTAEKVPETSASTFPPETAAPTENHLDTARHLLEGGDPAAAIALLEQALAETEDPQLRAMLETLTAPTPLILDFTAPSEEILVVHSFTAEESHTHQVRYCLDYTAPPGMQLRLRGRNLSHGQEDFLTSGERGCFQFEVAAEDVRKMEGKLELQFITAEEEIHALTVQTLWPGEEIDSFEVRHFLTDLQKTGNVDLHRFWVEEEEDHYHFTAEYTAAAGLRVDVLLQTETEDHYLWQEPVFTTGQRETLEFQISKELFADGKYMEVCFTDDKGVWVAANFIFPMGIRRTDAQPLGEMVQVDYLLNSHWNTNICQIHSLTAQQLDNGYVRFTLELSAPACSFVTVYGLAGTGERELDQFLSSRERQQYVFDIPRSTLRQSKSLSVLIGMGTAGSRFFEIPTGQYACTEGKPVSEAVALTVQMMDQPKAADAAILGGSVCLLDNGLYRYQLEVNAPENTRFTIFDPPNGDFMSRSFLTGQSGVQSLCFDVEPDVAAMLPGLTLIGQLPGKEQLSAAFDNTAVALTPEPVVVRVISCS